MGRDEKAIKRDQDDVPFAPRPGPFAGRVPRSLFVILFAAAMFRAIYFFLLSADDLLFDGLILDSVLYDAWGRAIADGAWIGSEAFYFPPLYAYLLGIVYRIVGHDVAPIYLLQSLLGVFNIYLIFRIGAGLFGRRIGIIAAAAAALYAPFAFYELKILGTTVGLTLNLVVLRLMVREEQVEAARPTAGRAKNRLRWVGIGLVIGAAALCWPATVLLAALYAALRARHAFRVTAALAIGTLLGLLPVLTHNLYVAGDFLPLSAQGGITFFQGNNPRATGLYSDPVGFSGAPERQAAEERAIAERETGRPLKRSQVSAHFFRKGATFIVTEPGRWLLLEARKLGRLIGNYEASAEYSIYLERSRIPWLHVTFLPFALIAGAGCGGLAGLIRGTARRPGTRALGVFTAYAAAVPLLFYVSSRYRLLLVPALIIIGAWFIDAVTTRLRSGHRPDRRQLQGLAIAVPLALAAIYPLGRASTSTEANVHYNLGTVLAGRDRHREAIAAYDRALADLPRHAAAWINRGNSLDRQGLVEEALRSYRKAAEVQPAFWPAYRAQGVILHRLGRLDEAEAVFRRGLAAGGAEAHHDLGVILDRLGRTADAETAFRAAIAADPAAPGYHNALGNALLRQGRIDDAKQAYLDANRAGPRYEKSRYNLATLLLRDGAVDEAAALLEDALRIEPRYARAHARLGEVLERQGDLTAARDRFRRALAIDSGDATARAGLERLDR